MLINGKPAKEYMSDWKTYIEGREGTKFSLRLRNNTSERKLFIPAIDGLSVMDGEDASEESGGYIVQPWSTITVDGWRKSNSEVAEFFFSSPKDSYRKCMKKGNNIGVIGVLVFDEKQKPISNYNFYCNTNFKGTINTTPTFSRSTSGFSGQSVISTSSVSNDLGTGWGDTKRSEVTAVDFKKTRYPTTFEIYYNTREQLENMGISFKEPVYVTPQAFPGRYCKAPGCQCERRGASECTC